MQDVDIVTLDIRPVGKADQVGRNGTTGKQNDLAIGRMLSPPLRRGGCTLTTQQGFCTKDSKNNHQSIHGVISFASIDSQHELMYIIPRERSAAMLQSLNIGGRLMNLQFDHLVHTVYDPNAVRQHFADAFGWRTVPGGKHIEWGTYNGLSYFGLSYIEWVGVFDEALAKTSEFGKWVLADLQRGEGVKQFALRTRRMDEIAAAWRARGLNAVGPVQGLRQREDGTTLRWRLLFPARTDVEAFPLPFLIEWEQDDRQREAGLVVAGALPLRQRSGCTWSRSSPACATSASLPSAGIPGMQTKVPK